MAKPIQITVGGGGANDPVDGASMINITSLAGAEYWIDSSGYGTLPYNAYVPLLNGGFTLLNGITFSQGEVYTIHITSYAFSSSGGSYTNGFHLPRVLAALFGRVGWKQPTLIGSPVIDTTNQISNSGRYFNDGSFHSLLTVKNIKDTVEEPGANDLSLNAYLNQLQRSIIMRCLNGVFNGPEVIEEVRLFERYGYNDIAIPNSGLFCGYEIDVAKTFDAGVQIDALTLLFDSSITFNIYLFKDGKVVPEWSQSVTTVANELTEIKLTDKVLSQGKYFIGYFQSDIGSAKAYRENISEWKCGKLFGARAVSARSTGATTFDRQNRYQSIYDNFGLNLDISSFKDHTRQIERKAAAFDELIGLMMTYAVIEQVLYCVRSNSGERTLKDELFKVGITLDLTGTMPISDPPQVMGLKQRIERELKRVKESFYSRPHAQTVSLC